MILKHKILVLVSATLMAVMLSAAPALAQEVPVAVYDVTFSGTTYTGSDVLFTPLQGETTYTPRENFSIPGTLVLTPTLDSTGANFDNGVNYADVGLFAGNPSIGPGGSIRYATNTGVLPLADQGSARTQGAELDLAFVDYDPETGVLDIQVDPNAARTAQLNTFLRSTGLFADPQQVRDGSMQLQFGVDGSVNGTLDFTGGGLIYPGSGRIQGTIDGTLQ